ncbi:RNA pseudouridine synthase [Thermodesulfomicrobium sp. WS]|uniref:RluA family pseudouridine synthase n=1 Tax=Thermodesulfomicrobium sp. WS TaxID=3004129 RepID=UPI002490DA5E|nr:RNA pseudouridine synthase [Thermodesulfomicrobium sp. WS]
MSGRSSTGRGMERFRRRIPVLAAGVAVDILAQATGLSKSRIKDCMTKGGVWLHLAGQKPRRLRRAQTVVRPGQELTIWYDPRLLQMQPPSLPALMIRDAWSIWAKPPGVPTQGSPWGDHLALTRLAAQHLGKSGELHPVYRLDTAASGLVLLAHTASSMAALSRWMQEGRITKTYAAVLAGQATWDEITVQAPIEGQAARSHFCVLARDDRRTWVRVHLATGRRHQIRIHAARHLHMPIVGDTRYGGPVHPMLLLACVHLSFLCPLSAQTVRVDDHPPQWPHPELPNANGPGKESPSQGRVW